MRAGGMEDGRKERGRGGGMGAGRGREAGTRDTCSTTIMDRILASDEVHILILSIYVTLQMGLI